MSSLEIRIYPDPILRVKCKPITEIDQEIRDLVSQMADTMYQAPGIGLAASQVGVEKRLFVADVGDSAEADNERGFFALINPEIVEREGSVSSEEGCLSIPGVTEQVVRSERVTVSALNLEGQEVELNVGGLLAVCFQHEIDHLDGVLFIDRLTKLRKELIKGKLKKFI